MTGFQFFQAMMLLLNLILLGNARHAKSPGVVVFASAVGAVLSVLYLAGVL